MLSFTAMVVIKKVFAGEDAAFIRFGPMLSPKDTWGPRLDRKSYDNFSASSAELGISEGQKQEEKTAVPDNAEIDRVTESSR